MTATLETPQHLEALDRANQLRFAQTDLLRDLSSNKVSLEVLLADERAASLKFERVLAAMAHRSDAVSAGVIRQSRGTARKIAKAAKVSLTREVGSLRCELTKEVLLACAYDVVGQFAWVYETDANWPSRTWARVSRTSWVSRHRRLPTSRVRLPLAALADFLGVPRGVRAAPAPDPADAAS